MRKTNLDMFLVPFQKKGWKIDHHVSNLVVFFFKGFRSTLKGGPPRKTRKRNQRDFWFETWGSTFGPFRARCVRPWLTRDIVRTGSFWRDESGFEAIGGKPKIVAKPDPSVSNSTRESIFEMNLGLHFIIWKLGFLNISKYLAGYGIQMHPSVTERRKQSGKKSVLWGSYPRLSGGGSELISKVLMMERLKNKQKQTKCQKIAGCWGRAVYVLVLCHQHHLPADHVQFECKHHRNKRERRAKWTYYVHNAYAGRYARVSCDKQYVPHLSWSLFSERPEICTP